jgi:O-succinylbenzoic acid--CoA ligase
LRIAGEALFSGMLIDDRSGGWRFDPRPGTWFETSDRARLAGRLLTPLGRADSVVKILGELVDPEAVERELADCSGGVLAAGGFAVLAVPDARAGHALVPVFERGGAEPAVVAAALAAYEETAPGFRRLRPAVWVDEMPRGALGKLRRAALADLVC